MWWEDENFIRRWVARNGAPTDRFFCYGDGLETRYITVVLLEKIVPLKQREAIEAMARVRYGLST